MKEPCAFCADFTNIEEGSTVISRVHGSTCNLNLTIAYQTKHSELAAAETNWTSAAVFSCYQGDGDLIGQERHSPETEVLQQLLRQ